MLLAAGLVFRKWAEDFAVIANGEISLRNVVEIWGGTSRVPMNAGQLLFLQFTK